MLIGVSLLRPGMNMTCKMFDTNTESSAQLLYLMACCFDSIQLVKPLISRPLNAEKYFVGLGRRGLEGDSPEISQYLGVMKDGITAYDTKNVYLDKLFEEKLPDDFTDWLQRHNDLFCEMQLDASVPVLDILEGKEPKLKMYDTHRALAIMGMPGNSIPRNSPIKLY